HRRGEDDRDYAGHVHAERHVGRAAAVIRRPTMRFAYWIGIRRWPSWMKTTATMIPIAISGKKSFSIGPPLIQAVIPAGAVARIEAKIRSEIPFPTPRFVIS